MSGEAWDMPPVPGAMTPSTEDEERDVLGDWRPDRVMALGLLMLAEKPHYFESHEGVPTMCGRSSCVMMRYSVHKFVAEVLEPHVVASATEPAVDASSRTAVDVLWGHIEAAQIEIEQAARRGEFNIRQIAQVLGWLEKMKFRSAEVVSRLRELERMEAELRREDLADAEAGLRPHRDPARYCGRCRIGERCSVPSCAGYRP